jgi:hypothetical protein
MKTGTAALSVLVFNCLGAVPAEALSKSKSTAGARHKSVTLSPPEEKIPLELEVLLRLGPIATGLGTLLLVHRSNRIASRACMSAAMAKFNDRFAAICAAKGRVCSDAEARSWFEELWGHQVDQFRQYLMGAVDRRVFAGWMAARQDEFRANSKIGRYSYQAGFRLTVPTWKGCEDFTAFMNDVFESGPELAIRNLESPRKVSSHRPARLTGVR